MERSRIKLKSITLVRTKDEVLIIRTQLQIGRIRLSWNRREGLKHPVRRREKKH